MLVGGDLHLDVARGGDEPLDVQALVAERGPGLAAGQAEQALQLALVLRELDPAAAAASRRLDQQRVGDVVGLGRRRDFVTGEDRQTRSPRRLASPQLVAGELHHLRRRSDERQVMITRSPGERRVLGEEAVAGVDRVAAGPERCLNDDVVTQVALRCRTGSDDDDAVGEVGGKPVAIHLGGADDRLKSEAAARGHDPDRDLAAVGDEHPLHAGRTRNSGAPYSARTAFSWHTSTTVPETPAGIEFIIFITSMMQTIVSGSTVLPTSTNGGLPGPSAR